MRLPAALRVFEPRQIRKEAALRIPLRCRGFLPPRDETARSPRQGRSQERASARPPQPRRRKRSRTQRAAPRSVRSRKRPLPNALEQNSPPTARVPAELTAAASVRLCTCAVEASDFETRSSSTAPSAATPIATPLSLKALLIPDAIPDRAGSTVQSAEAASVGFASPMPTPPHHEAGEKSCPTGAGRQAVHQQQANRHEQ